MKNEMSSVDVSAIVFEWNHGPKSLLEAKVGKIYQPTPDSIRISIFIPEVGRDNLMLEAGKRAHISKYLPSNPKVAQSFPMLLRKHLMGGKIVGINQHDFDRIIELNIVRGGVKTVLVIELFAKGNIVLLDEKRKIILPMKPVTFKGRKIRSGEIYEYPQSKANPLNVTISTLKELFITSNSDVVRTVATKMNLGGILAEEVCLIANIDKSRVATEISEEEVEQVHSSLMSVLSPLNEGLLKPNIVLKNEDNDVKPIDVNPFELLYFKDFEKKYFESFNLALDEFFGKSALTVINGSTDTVKKEKLGLFERRLKQQQDAIKKFEEQADKYIQAAEKIYSNYQTIEEIMNVLYSARENGYSWDEIKRTIKESKNKIKAANRITNINSSKGIITLDLDGTNIELDINRSIPQNAEKYYKHAKKVTRKKDGALKAIEDTKKAMKKKEKKVPTKKRIKRKEAWYERFRWFISSDGFLIIGGRDADTNEEIVKKYMEKRDFFLHTQAPGAPVVIIKTEGSDVPEKTIYEAAEFVVSYSNLWKLGYFEGDCYLVKPEQVSKTPESGEYVKKGSFIIRGTRSYYKNVPINAAIGIDKKVPRVIGGPITAINNHGTNIVKLSPGKFNQNDIAKKIYRLWIDSGSDTSFMRGIASPDKIAKMLPPGGSEIVG